MNPLYENSNFVPGIGPKPAQFMFVGEAPGREEDEHRRPFIGSAGKVLNQLLYMVGLKREDVYITNVVKFRPPNNRTPTLEEIKASLPLLIQEIKEVKPKCIVALGEVAAIALVEKDMSWRGNIVSTSFPDIPPTSVLITFHPAYLLRNRNEFATVVHDLTKLFDPPPVYTQNYILDPSPEVLCKYLFEKWKDAPVAVDIETAGEEGEGLNPFADNIIGIAFCGSPGEAISVSLKESKGSDIQWQIIKQFLESDTPKVFQNNLFDRMFLLQKGIKVRNLVWDTQGAMHVLYSDARKGLDYLRSLYTNVPPYKRVYKKRGIGVAHLTKLELQRYNCLDVDVTLQVYEAQKRYFTPTQEKVRKWLLQLEDVALEMRNRGVEVDTNRLVEYFAGLSPLIEKIEEEFFERYKVEISSPLQVARLLFETCKVPPPKSAYKGKRLSVDEDVLRDILNTTLVQETRELVEHVLEYRGYAKTLSTYVVGIYKLLRNARLHPDWKPTGTDTGRWACRNPNLQNIPEFIRDIFISKKGYKLYIADYSQLELLTGAILAGEYELVEAIQKGRDVHEEVRQEMSQVMAATRMQAKGIVFGTMYGLSPRTAAVTFRLPVQIIEGWQRIAVGRFPKLAKLKDKTLEFFQKHGYVESWFGRRKYCETPTQALNHPVQSTAVDITLHALVKLEEKKFRPVLTIHDENVCEVPDDDPNLSVDEFAKIVHNPVPELCSYFPAKIRVSDKWKKEKE